MALSINTNIPSLQTDKEINKRQGQVNKGFERLSSGKAINRASDDPAGLAVAVELLANAGTSSVAARNISDGVSAANIADGALESASSIVTRLSELAAQASNGTLSATQRSALNNEYQALSSELDRISQTTEFNGQQLLSQSSSVTIQAGITGSSTAQISLGLPGVSASSLGLATDISTQENARAALDKAKVAQGTLAEARGQLGSGLSRLGEAFENLKTSELNTREAASRILDADVAAESARLVANQIGLQAGVAVKSQANLLPQLALNLLK